MNPLEISEADCALLDVVLALSFDTEELLNCCQSGGVEPPHCHCSSRSVAVVGAVHRACHRDPAFARLMERRLNVVHRTELLTLERLGLEGFGAQLLGRSLGEVPRLAGKLWALTTCRDPDAECLRVYVRNRLALAGAQSIAASQEAA